MKKSIMFVVLLFVFMCPSFVFAKKFDNKELLKSDVASYLKTIVSRDGNYVSVGLSWFDDPDAWFPFGPKIIKYDKNGKIIWEHILEKYNFASAFVDIVEVDNGDFFVVGSVHDPAAPFIARLDKEGNVIWDKVASLNSEHLYNGAYNAIKQVGENFLAVGTIKASSPSYGYFTIYDVNGDVLKHEKIPIDIFSSIGEVILLEDGFLFGGTCYPDGTMSSPTDVCFAKYNLNYEKVWHKSYGTNRYDSIVSLNEKGENFNAMLRSYTAGEEDYTYKLIQFDGNGNNLLEKDLISLSNNYVSDYFITDNDDELVFGCVGTNCGLASFDSTYNLKDMTALTTLKDASGYFSDVGDSSNEFFVSLFIRNQNNQINENFFNGYVFRSNYIHNIEKNSTVNGTYDVEVKDDELIITPKPDKGFETFRVVVRNSKGIKVETIEKNGKYYVEFNDSMNIYVWFDKINDNDGYTLLKKDWDYKKDYFPEDDFDMLIYFSGYDNYVNNNYVAYKNNLKNNVAVGNLSVLNKNGLLLKEKEFDNFMIYDIDILNDNIYVLGFENFDEENQKVILKRFDKQLTKLKEIEIVNFPNSFGMFFELSVFCSLDLFKVYNNEIYVPVNSGYAIYDEKLESSRINSNFEEICNFSEQYCLITDESSNDNEQIFGFDKNDNYKVLSGNRNVDDKNVSFVKLLNLQEEEVFNKTIEKYNDISTVLFFKNYIVGIGIIGDLDFTEIFVMDLEGNIVQTINDSVLFTRLKIVDEGFLTLVVDLEEDSTCDLGDSDFCVSTSRRLYTYSLDIKASTNEKGSIEIVNNAKPGETVEVKVTPKIGYKFEGLRITDASGNVTVVNGTSFVMPDSAVSVEPIFSLVISNVVQEIVNPDTGSFISLLALWIFALTSVAIYKYVKKKQPILKI